MRAGTRPYLLALRLEHALEPEGIWHENTVHDAKTILRRGRCFSLEAPREPFGVVSSQARYCIVTGMQGN